MKHFLYIFIAFILSCSKFEEQNPKLCLTPHIDFVYRYVKTDAAGLTIQVDSVIIKNKVNKYTWDFGDGYKTNLAKPSHPYPKDVKKNIYKLSLTAENECGISVWYEDIDIGGCLASPDFDTIVSGYTVTFIDKSKEGDLPITSYRWDFGEGRTSALKNPPPIPFSSHGIKQIFLTVSSACGPNTISKTVNITCDRPIACSSGCILIKPVRFATYEFSNGINDLNIKSIDWDFNDGTFGNGSPISHFYGKDGKYSVTMKITNICGQVFSFKYPNSIDILKPTTIADREYNTETIQEFNAKGPFHQLSYYQNKIYVLAKDNSFYNYDSNIKSFATLQKSPVLMDKNNALFRDASDLTISNFGSNGSFRFENDVWKIWPYNGTVTDFLIAGYDCSLNGIHIPLEIVDGTAIRYNSTLDKFYILGNDKKLYASKYGKYQEFEFVNSINYIDEYSKSMINNRHGIMYFTFAQGIVSINSEGEIINLFQNLKFQSGPPKKILLDNLDQLYSLDYNGNFARINQVTGNDELITTGINDFDLILNSSNTNIVVCDSSSVKILNKN